MLRAGAESLPDQRLVCFQEQQTELRRALAQAVAIARCERGAGEHRVASLFANTGEFLGEAVEPGPAVRVIERLAPAHFGDVALSMKPIALEELRAQLARKRPAERGLTRTRHAHHHDDHRSRSIWKRQTLAQARGASQSAGAHIFLGTHPGPARFDPSPLPPHHSLYPTALPGTGHAQQRPRAQDRQTRDDPADIRPEPPVAGTPPPPRRFPAARHLPPAAPP